MLWYLNLSSGYGTATEKLMLDFMHGNVHGAVRVEM